MADKPIKAIAFDVDGTLVRENFWGALNRAGGLPEAEDMHFFELYVEGKLGYRDWMGKIAKTYQANPPKKDEVEKILQMYAFAPGAEDLIRNLSRYPLALISSNIDTYVKCVAERLGIEHAYGYTTIEYDGDRFSGIGFQSEATELKAKVEALEDFAGKVGVSLDEIAFVGDSRNDLEAFTATGRGVLIGEGNEELRRAAWKRIGGLNEILGIV